MNHRIFLIMLLIGSISSCRLTDKEEIDLKGIELSLDFTPLEKEFFQTSSKEDILQFLITYEGPATALFGYDDQNLEVVESMYDMRYNPFILELKEEVYLKYDDYAQLRQELEKAFKRIKYYFPEFAPPKVYTMLTGMGTDLYVSPEMVIIGIDFFLGDGAKFRPNDLPQYILQRYQPSYISPAVVLLLSDQFNLVNPADNSMLAEMIAVGKSHYFSSKILPTLQDYEIISWHAEIMADVKENEELIWAHFIENSLLYESSHFIKNKYLGERPFVAEIGRRCPGRIGAWLGWRIVESYMKKNPSVSFQELMSNDDAQAIFQASGYRPGR
jgi:hypothetical protein